MSWDSFVVVTDADLARFEPESTNPDEPWGAATWDDQIEQAKRTLRVWIDSDYGDMLGASDRLRDRWAFSEAKTFIASAWQDVVTEASDATEEDIDLAATFATPGSDFIYLGAAYTFTGVYVDLLDSVNAAASVLTVAYWSENQWKTVPSQTDGTIASAGKTLGQSGRVTWGPIRDWERRSLNGSDEGIYWVRLSVSLAMAAGTSSSHLVAIKHPEGLRTVASFLSLSYILRGLALQTPDSEEWRTRADEYMEDAKVLYDRMKTSGGIPLDVNLSGAVEPSEIGSESSSVAVVGRMPRA